MTQQPLFCEDIYEALRTIGQAFGGSKKIGAYLWPDKPIEKASELWANCLNRTRPEKLDPEQVIAVLKIGRQEGCHAGVHFIAEQCGYRFEAIEPEDERAALQRLYIQSVESQKELVKRMEALSK
jgi:hypothetical protein